MYLDQEIFYLDRVQIEITHEYRYFGIDFYSHDYFEPSSKRQRMENMKVLMDTLREIVGVMCWDLKFHLFKALVLLTFIYDTKTWGGDSENS